MHLIKLNFKNFTIYRTNFYISFVGTLLWTAAYVIFIEVIFQHINTLAGWDKGGMLLIMSFYYLFQNVGNVFFRDNFENFGDAMRQGQLDLVLTKPAPLKMLLFFNKIRMDSLAAFIINIFLFAYAIRELSTPISIEYFILGIIYTGISIIFFFYFLLFVTTFTFWFQKNETLNTIIWNLLQIGRYPRQIYQDIAKIFFVFLIPLALVASIPTEIALRFGSWKMAVYFIGVTIVFAIISNIFFHYGLKQYSSAG